MLQFRVEITNEKIKERNEKRKAGRWEKERERKGREEGNERREGRKKIETFINLQFLYLVPFTCDFMV